MKDGVKFIEYISNEGSICLEKLANCLDPEMDLEQINADISAFNSSYFNGTVPTASQIKTSNVVICEEDSSISFDAVWIFSDFKDNNINEAKEDLICSEEELTNYMLQTREDILKVFGLRNNRFSQPSLEINFT